MSMIWTGFWIKNINYIVLVYNSCMFKNCCVVFSQFFPVSMRQKGSIQIQWAEKTFLCSFPEWAGSTLGEQEKAVHSIVEKYVISGASTWKIEVTGELLEDSMQN